MTNDSQTYSLATQPDVQLEQQAAFEENVEHGLLREHEEKLDLEGFHDEERELGRKLQREHLSGCDVWCGT